MNKEQIIEVFKEKFGDTNAEVYFSPGRVNLIGEHTDYNGSFVFPGAIDKGIIAAIKLNGTNKIRAFAVDLNESSEFGFEEENLPKESWAKYVFGVCR
jgi:galactokinase